MNNRNSILLTTIFALALSAGACANQEDQGANNPMASPTPMLSPTGSPMLSPSPTGTGMAGNTGYTHTIQQVHANVDSLVGQTVTVVADVEEVLTPRAFKLDEDSPEPGPIDKDLLVLSPQAGNLADIDDQWLNNKVRVTGTVRRMVVNELNRELGWNLTPNVTNKYKDQAVIVARSVERVR